MCSSAFKGYAWHLASKPDNFEVHSGSTESYNNTPVLFKITDNGAPVSDTRTWMGHYEADSSINELMPYHYAAGGRFKKRVILNSDGSWYSIKGTKADNLYHAAAGSNTYDGTRLTSDTIPFVNNSNATMYHGQIGDFLYIDRRWTAWEPKPGVTHIKQLETPVTGHTTTGVNYSTYTGNVRWYASEIDSPVISTKIRKNEGWRNKSIQSAQEGEYPQASSNDHKAPNGANQFISHIQTNTANGDEAVYTNIDGSESGYEYNTGNDIGAKVGGQRCGRYDINRYPGAFETISQWACEMKKIQIGETAFENIYATQLLSNTNFSSTDKLKNRLMISASSNDESFVNVTDINSAETEEYHTWSNLFISTALSQTTSKANTSYDNNSKLILRALTPNEDIGVGNEYGTIWSNGIGVIAAGSTAKTFISPLKGRNTGTDFDFYDFENEHFEDIILTGYTQGDSLISITPNNTGSAEFGSGQNIKYKISLLYDGYQESPLSKFFYDITMASDYQDVSITLRLNSAGTLSKRVTHLILYRANTDNDLYRFVKQIPLESTEWSKDNNGNFIHTLTDRKVFGSYSSLTGISEGIDNTSLNYELSAQINDELFVANAWHPEIEDSSRYIFKSKPGNFSQFDFSKDYLVLDTIPVALASFAGKIYAFDRKNTYRINPEQMFVEDKFEGVGCLSQDAVVVTEFGMCYADSNNVYIHDGVSAKPIGNNILTSSTYEGWEIGWQKSAKYSEETVGIKPFIFYDGETNSFLCFVHGSCDHQCAVNVSRVWAYNITRNRWDYWESPKVIKATQGKDGDVLISDGTAIYNYKDNTSLRDWSWLSKKLSFTKTTNDKRFHRINIMGSPSLATISTPAKWNDDLVVYVDGEIQQLTKMNTKFTKSFAGCFLDHGTYGPNWLDGSTTTLFLKGRNDDSEDFLGIFPTINTYVMVDDEIMLITAVDKESDPKRVTVTRGQLGTAAVAHTITSNTGEGYEGQRLFYVSPTIKLPAKCKGKNIEVLLQNQKGVVDAIQIEYINKGRAK